MDAAIATVVGGIDLSPYYTSAQTDAAIAAALVPVAPLSNVPAWSAKPAHVRAAEGKQGKADSKVGACVVLPSSLPCWHLSTRSGLQLGGFTRVLAF